MPPSGTLDVPEPGCNGSAFECVAQPVGAGLVPARTEKHHAVPSSADHKGLLGVIHRDLSTAGEAHPKRLLTFPQSIHDRACDRTRREAKEA